jgi:peroxiredoxin Q/BCP
MLTVGSPAPEFQLEGSDAKHHSLADYKGKWVILYFYPKDSTPGCTLEAQEFTARKEEFESLNATILGVSADSIESHKKFCDKKQLTIALLSDPNQKTLEAYGVWQEKKMYGKTFMGIVRTTVLIDPKGAIVEIWSKVKVKGHVDQVLETLKAKV